MRYSSFLVLLLSFYLTSCITTRELDYVQKSVNHKIENEAGYIEMKKEEYIIQVDNILSLNIISKDEKLNALFGTQHTSGINSAGEALFFISGLSVMEDGSVSIPSIGKVFIAGLNLEQARHQIENELYKIYKRNIVFAKLQMSGISFTILGDVRKPGTYTVYKNRLNILEAIAKAGDLNITARRKKLKLIRQYPEGKKIIYLDLTREDLMLSPYFHLQPNDMLVVSHKMQKTLGTGTNFFGTISTLASVISTSIVLFYTIGRVN